MGVETPLCQQQLWQREEGLLSLQRPWVLHAHKAPSTERGESLDVSQTEVHIESKCQFHSRPYFGSSELSHPFKVHTQVM